MKVFNSKVRFSSSIFFSSSSASPVPKTKNLNLNFFLKSDIKFANFSSYSAYYLQIFLSTCPNFPERGPLKRTWLHILSERYSPCFLLSLQLSVTVNTQTGIFSGAGGAKRPGRRIVRAACYACDMRRINALPG